MTTAVVNNTAITHQDMLNNHSTSLRWTDAEHSR